ncbi:MAG: NAD-dependent epimerase/dehydratase family protein [Vulcanimicrobiaceae bacterium]
MNVLIIGGTSFVGRHIAIALKQAGHDVTLFNRGQSNPEALRKLPQIHGDRTRDLARTGNRSWDAVIDTSGYVPYDIELSARYFATRTRHYVFISSISVFDASGDEITEETPMVVLPEGADRTTMSPENYGALKVLCEHVVQSTYRDRATIVRPAVVCGPFDPTDRFTYYPVRIAEGGSVLMPDASYKLMMIDSRDLARFVVRVIEHSIAGDYNCVAPNYTFGDLARACTSAAHVRADFTFASDAVLQQHGIEPWTELPLWLPLGMGHDGAHHPNARRALGAGLEIRALTHTAADTLAWAKTLTSTHEWKAGMSRSREAEVLSTL